MQTSINSNDDIKISGKENSSSENKSKTNENTKKDNSPENNEEKIVKKLNTSYVYKNMFKGSSSALLGYGILKFNHQNDPSLFSPFYITDVLAFQFEFTAFM